MITTKINVENHLAEYCIGKWGIDFSEPVRFPDNSDVYHTLYELTDKRPVGCKELGNLEVALPTCTRDGDIIRKNPEVYNYISARSSCILNRKIKIMFWAELHEFLDSQKHMYGIAFQESIFIFMCKYRLTKITEDALYKNYQRWRQLVRQKDKRSYKKSA